MIIYEYKIISGENMKSYSPIELHKKLFNEITPSLRWNGITDINDHKKKCEEKLKELLGWDTFKECEPNLQIIKEEELNGSKYVHFIVETEKGYYANCHLLMPTVFEGRLPLCVGLQGHVSGAHLSLGVNKYDYDEVYLAEQHSDFCIQAINNGYIGLAIEQRAFGDNTGRETPGGTNCGYIAMQANLMGRTLVGERVWDVKQVINAVESHFSNIITMENSVLIGESGGGTATFYSACLLDDFSIYVPGVAVCTFKDSIINKEHCVCNYIPSIARYFDMGDLAVLIAPKKLIVVSALHDKWFPIEGAKKAYAQIEKIYKSQNAQRNCAMIIGEGDHRSYPEKTWSQIKKMLNI